MTTENKSSAGYPAGVKKTLPPLELAQANLERMAVWYDSLPGDPPKGVYSSAFMILRAAALAIELALVGKEWEPPK